LAADRRKNYSSVVIQPDSADAITRVIENSSTYKKVSSLREQRLTFVYSVPMALDREQPSEGASDKRLIRPVPLMLNDLEQWVQAVAGSHSPLFRV